MSGEPLTIRARLEAIRDRVGDPHVRRSTNLNYQDAVAALDLLDEAVLAPSWEWPDGQTPFRIVPDPVVSSIATRD